MRKQVNLKTYAKRNQFHWFSTFPDPSYGFNVDIDVDAVVKLAKSNDQSFFPYFLFLVTKALNAVPELRMREIGGKVYAFDQINPTWTVMTDCGVYANTGMKMDWNFSSFYRKVRALIAKTKKMKPGDDLDIYPICHEPDVIYSTCVPFLSIQGMTHPTPAGNHDSLSVPRVFWDQYRLGSDNRFHLTLNITVSHTLVDGFPLGQCFSLIKAECLDPKTGLQAPK